MHPISLDRYTKVHYCPKWYSTAGKSYGRSANGSLIEAGWKPAARRGRHRVTEMTTDGVLELTRDEIVRRIERGAQRRLHMSARELVQAYRSGRLEDPGLVADLLALSSLLAESDPLFVPA